MAMALHQFAISALFAASLAAQLKLAPSEPLERPRPAPKPKAEADRPIRPAILRLEPAADPIHIVEESGDGARIHRRAVVDSVSKDAEGIALGGYDPVSYFNRRPESGKKEIATEYLGATWRFSDATNQAAFTKEPEAYAPQYGGFCAYATGKGYPATADPLAWSLQDGKLYLFFNKIARDVWEQDRPALTRSGARNWPRLHR